MRNGFLLAGVLLVQFLFCQSVFAQYPMTYDFLMELGTDNLNCGDYQEALHYFERAQLINPKAEEPKRHISFINGVLQKEKVEEDEAGKKAVRAADLYKWERGLEKLLEDSAAQYERSIEALGKQIESLLAQRQASTGGLSELKEINQALRNEIVSLKDEIGALQTQRRQEQASFYKQLKEEITGVRHRYTQRLQVVQDVVEKDIFEREKFYGQMEEITAKIEEKWLKIPEAEVQRDAEETALDKYEREIQGDITEDKY